MFQLCFLLQFPVPNKIYFAVLVLVRSVHSSLSASNYATGFSSSLNSDRVKLLVPIQVMKPVSAQATVQIALRVPTSVPGLVLVSA